MNKIAQTCSFQNLCTDAIPILDNLWFLSSMLRVCTQ